jgi:hypothetical protein
VCEHENPPAWCNGTYDPKLQYFRRLGIYSRQRYHVDRPDPTNEELARVYVKFSTISKLVNLNGGFRVTTRVQFELGDRSPSREKHRDSVFSLGETATVRLNINSIHIR